MTEDVTGATDLDELSFEELLERLESLVAKLSSGEVGIEAAADLYEESGRVYSAAKGRLDAVQARIQDLRQDPEPPPPKADQPAKG